LRKVVYVSPTVKHAKPDVVQAAVKENKIKKSRLLSQIADFNAKGKTESKVVPGSRKQVERDISATRILRSNDESPKRKLRNRK